MPTLPSVLTRPLLDVTPAPPAPDGGAQASVQLDLTAGIPALIALDACAASCWPSRSVWPARCWRQIRWPS